jgi:hypothetical protein
MHKIINNLDELFSVFGKTYDAEIENINGKKKAVNFDGVDYLTLTPNDTICDFNYFRLLNESNNYIDLGGCSKELISTKQKYKWVYFSKKKQETESIRNLFIQNFPKYLNLKIENSYSNQNELFRSESGEQNRNLKLKKWSYLSFDISILVKTKICQKIECI